MVNNAGFGDADGILDGDPIYQELFSELGMETVAAGYEFAHRDDYEGRRVIPTLKVDADAVRAVAAVLRTEREWRVRVHGRTGRVDERALAELAAETVQVA